MERDRILERERRWSRPAAAAAILAAPLYFLSLWLDQGGEVPETGLATERYRTLDAAGGEIYAAVTARGLAYLCLAVTLLYLFKAAQARSERIGAAMVGFAFIGPVLLAVQAVIAAIARGQIASDFVAQAGAGGDVYSLLDRLVEDSAAHDTAFRIIFPGILGTLIALVYISMQAMRVGLLTRFAGTLGMALGATLILIPFGMALLLIFVWLIWLGFLFLDRTPGPRPPAWGAGVAIPWPRPGEQPVEVEEEEAPPELFDPDGDGSADARDHSARRERAKKRKRKRRQ